MIGIALFMVLGRKLMETITTHMVNRSLPALKLKKGMIITKCPLLSEEGGVPAGTVVNQHHIDQLKYYLRRNQHLDVQETIPLAPYMFAAALLTLLLHTDIISWLLL